MKVRERDTQQEVKATEEKKQKKKGRTVNIFRPIEE